MPRAVVDGFIAGLIYGAILVVLNIAGVGHIGLRASCIVGAGIGAAYVAGQLMGAYRVRHGDVVDE